MVSNVKSKDNVCKDKVFRGEESVSSLQTRKVDNTKRSMEWSRITNKILAVQLKLSRYAQEDKHCIHLMLIRDIVSSHDSKMEVLISIVEDMRTILRSTDFLRFLLAMTHTEIQYDRI